MRAKSASLITIYLVYTRANIRRILEYRSSFFIGFAAILSRHVIGILTLWVIFSTVQALGGWNAYQVVYLYAYVNLIAALWHFFFANTIRMEFLVQSGDLDWYLVRPLPPLFQLMLYYFDDDALGDIVPAVLLLVISSVRLGIAYTFGVVIVFAAGLLGGVMIHFGIHLILSSWSFWFIKSRAIIGLFTEIKRFSEYPLRIFSFPIQLILSILVPIAFAGYYPAERILTMPTLSVAAFLSLPVGMIVLAAGLAVWHYGLTKYQSTGS
ncbi:ABC transporter permease [Acidobacteriota bacterium]